MRDNYGRTIEYLRISVTDRCNLRCIHCMPEGGVDLMRHEDILSYEEIAAVAAEAAKLGVRKIRLTGGEPLVRPHLHRLVALLKEIPGIETVVLTTNAVLLKDQLPDLQAAGLDGVNISLNAMDRASYRAFTGRDLFDPAREGLLIALDAPQLRVKVNCVPTKGREEQLLQLAELSRDTRASVRFIELMPIGCAASYEGISNDEVKRRLIDVYGQGVKAEAEGGGPAEYMMFEGFRGKVGFISPISHSFCLQCNRLRLTCDGKLKLCLASLVSVDLKFLIRSGASDEDISATIIDAVKNKPSNHEFSSGVFDPGNSGMIGIGG